MHPLSEVIPGFHAQWPAPSWVRTWSTERDFDLGFQGSTSRDQVEFNRQHLGQVLGMRPQWLNQDHGVRVRTDDDTLVACADAVVTRRDGVGCGVLTADCLPVLFCHTREPVVAAAHAGWRGLVDGVLEAALEAMEVERNGILAWLGPAIGPDSFEVGAEVRERFVQAQAAAEHAFREGG
ncbi:MAG: hypothetical protein G3H99_07660, partial [Ferrovum sp.]|nr:hypothetical protein [Ferrovum sp.]